MIGHPQTTLSEEPEKGRQKILQLSIELEKFVLGQQEAIHFILVALLSRGHVLLEGLPGVAKTLLAKTLSQCLDCRFQRIQFTPDLLPSDLIGTSIYHPEDHTFSVSQGPIFTDFLLADEINRAPPKVQSALLEVMGERQVTLAKETFLFTPFFMVMATQNPIEQEGTYPLPEAQADRFNLKITMPYPSMEYELQILSHVQERNHKKVSQILNKETLCQIQEMVSSLYVDPKALQYLMQLIQATRNLEELIPQLKNALRYGASPRASLHLLNASQAEAFLQGRGYLLPEDIKAVAKPVLRHRLKLSFDALAEGWTTDLIIDKILETLPLP